MNPSEKVDHKQAEKQNEERGEEKGERAKEKEAKRAAFTAAMGPGRAGRPLKRGTLRRMHAVTRAVLLEELEQPAAKVAEIFTWRLCGYAVMQQTAHRHRRKRQWRRH
jgi:hypothetical protein